MNKKIIIIISFFLLGYFSLELKGAEIAVIPYKIINQSEKFSFNQGKIYAKYMGLIALINNGFDIYNPRELDNDLKLMGINPNNIIDKDELALLCKSRRLTYILSGTILKTIKGYRVKSILYSAARNGIVSRSDVTAGNLYRLATRDAGKLLFAFKQNKNFYKKSIDSVIVYDGSYNILKEWGDVKKGIIKFSSDIFNFWQGSKIYLVPFGDKIRKDSYRKGHLTIHSVRKSLKNKKLLGTNKKSGFYNAFSYAIKSINWRKNCGHLLIIITNSKYNSNYFLRQFLPQARKKNIKIYTLSLGKVFSDDSIRYSLLAKSTNGRAYNVTYRQSLYDNKGRSFYLYMENGRFFQGELNNNNWRRGLFAYLKSNNDFVNSPGYADEVRFKKKNAKIFPYNMADKYKNFSARVVMGKKEVKNNITDIMLAIVKNYSKNNNQNLSKKPLARVMFSSGNMTLWSDVVTKKDLNYLQAQNLKNNTFYMGVQLISKRSEIYGITLNPYKYIFNISTDYLTEDLVKPLHKLIQKPDYYMEKGLLNPPFWFIKVKVKKLQLLKVRKDFREM